ncbi:MAG: hypothetical protein ACR2KU_14310 [Gammaproteobacteria bacterium]
MDRLLNWLIIKRGAEGYALNPRVARPLLWLLMAVSLIPIVLYLYSHVVDDAKLPSLNFTIAFYLVAPLYIGRLLYVEHITYKPGPMEVLDFVNATGNESINCSRLTSLFRMCLSEVYLSSNSAVPSRSTTEPMGVVQVANPTPEGIVSAALLALVALWPRYSYRISGTLITRAETPGYGVVFDVKRYGAREGASDVRWAVSWDEAVADAAYAATALILPYTGLSAKAPWTSWQGKMLPPMLFGHYQRAQKLSNGRRYDEALYFYYRALDLDPHNVSIRLQIAMLQERLGLFIDALDTYLNLHKLIQLRTWRPPPSEQRSKADGGQLGL